MSNVFVDKKDKQKPMYNPTLKQEFIEFKGKSYLGKLRAIFRKSYELETELHKDLYEFSLEELEDLFHVLNLKNVVDTHNSIKYYLDYCKEQGLLDTNIMLSLSPHYFEEFIESKRYRINLSTKEMYILKRRRKKIRLRQLAEFIGCSQSR